MNSPMITIGPDFYRTVVIRCDGTTYTVPTRCDRCGGTLPDNHRMGCRSSPRIGDHAEELQSIAQRLLQIAAMS